MKRYIALILAVCLLLVISTPALASVTSENQGLAIDRHQTYTTALYLLPDSAGQYTELTSSAGENWDCVNDPILTPDNDDTFVYCSTEVPTEKTDAYNLTAPSFIGDNQTITSVTVFFRHATSVGINYNAARPFLRLGTDETVGTFVNSIGIDTWATSNEVLARPGNGAWTTDDFASLQVGIKLTSPGYSVQERCTQIYVRVIYTAEEAKAPPFTLGEPPSWITAPTISANFTTSLNPTFPLASLIQDVSDASGTPSQLPFTIIAGVIILACSLMFGWFLRRFGAPSLFIKIAIIVGLMGVMVAVKWLDWWIIILFIIIGTALAMGSQTKWTATTG